MTEPDLRALEILEARATVFPGYFITRDGRVISTIPWRGQQCRVLRAHPNRYGYYRVHVTQNGRRKQAAVHKLVAAAFLPSRPSSKHELRHLDGNKANNRDTNLAWGTRKDNADDRERHGRTARGVQNGFAKLTDENVRQILTAPNRCGARIARQMGISASRAQQIRRGDGWQHIRKQPSD